MFSSLVNLISGLAGGLLFGLIFGIMFGSARIGLACGFLYGAAMAAVLEFAAGRLERKADRIAKAIPGETLAKLSATMITSDEENGAYKAGRKEQVVVLLKEDALAVITVLRKRPSAISFPLSDLGRTAEQLKTAVHIVVKTDVGQCEIFTASGLNEYPVVIERRSERP